MTLNPDLVRSRCAEIEESVQRLEALAARPAADLLADQDALDIACYRLLVAIEAALALCYHVTARRLRRTPEDYADCFAVLGKAGIIPPDLTQRRAARSPSISLQRQPSRSISRSMCARWCRPCQA